MQLGVNFTPSAALGLGYNQDALRALRPAVVRHVILDTAHLNAWIDAARVARARVLWVIPPEVIGVGAARFAIRGIMARGADLTVGIEIGHAPWQFGVAPEDAAARFLMLSELARYRDPLFVFPVIAGLGHDGSLEASAWFKRFLWFARHGAHFDRSASAIGVHAVAPGRPFRRRLWARVARQCQDAFGLPLAFTRVGWQIGQPLSRLRTAIEYWRDLDAAKDTGADLKALEPPAVVTPQVRGRWILDAWHHAEALGASHFLLEAPHLNPVQGHAWPLYDQDSQRADHVWTTLNWRAESARVAEAAASPA